MKSFKELVTENGVAANCMGASSSTPGTGAIDTFDPLLKKKPLKRKKPTGVGESSPSGRRTPR